MFSTISNQLSTNTRGISTNNIKTRGSGSSLQNNFTAITNPTINDDTSAGYSAGSQWINTALQTAYICTDSTTGAAVWLLLNDGSGAPGGVSGNVQFNNAGSFGGTNNLHWNNTLFRLGINNASPTSSLHVTGDTHITTNLIVGDGSWRQKMEDFDYIFEYNNGVTWIPRLEIEGEAPS